MTYQIAITLAVLLGSVALFVTEKVRVDVVGLLAMTALLATGVLSPESALAGFGNPATVTVAAMFILSAGLLKTGAGEIAGEALAKMMERSQWVGVALLMLFVGTVSAFINNTAAVAILLPIVLGVSTRIGVSPSRLLMPLSFASMFGGVCTLIGTSTNLLAGQIAVERGAEPFRMFEFAPLGLVFFAVGVVYMLTLGNRLIPDRRSPEDLTANFDLADYLTDVVVKEESRLAGSRLLDLEFLRDLEIDVIEIRRGVNRQKLPPSRAVLKAGDVLRIRTSLRTIQRLKEGEDLDFAPTVKWRDEELADEDNALVEVVIPAGSGLAGTTLERSRFRSLYGASVLAIRHRGQVLHERLKQTILRAGDTLLLEIHHDRLPQLRGAGKDLIFVSESQLGRARSRKLLPAAVILTLVVTAASIGLAPIVVAALCGCVAMVLTRCLTIDEAYQAVDWKIIFLLGGVLGLGRALEETGGAALLAEHVVGTFAFLGPIAVLSGFYLLTSLMTEAMSNNATVVLLAPVAMVTAETLGVDSRPFLMAVTFAASASFMTPVGYQTNTLIYGPGRYRFSDFIRVGLPLNVLFWVLATLLIPVIWPL